MTLYSDDVKRVIKSYDWPPGNRLRLDPVDGHDDITGTEYLVLRIYRNNFSSFDGVEQLKIAKIFSDLIPRLTTMGIPTILDVAKGDGLVAR